MNLRIRILCFFVAAASTACGGQADSGPITSDAVTDGGAASGPTSDVPDAATDARVVADAGECPSALTFLGNEEPIVAKAEVAPQPAGGVIVDGTYVLTRAVLYTGDGGTSGPTAQTAGLTIRMAGGVAEIVADGGRTHATATFAVSGTTLTTHQTCPSPRDQTVGFTAAADTLVVFMPRTSPPSSTLVETLTRQ